MVEVAQVVHARLGHQVGGQERVRCRRRKPATQTFSGDSAVNDLTRFNGVPFFLLAHAPVVAGVEHAMRHEFPMALEHGLGNVGVHVQNRHGQRHGAGQIEPVEHLHQSPNANPVAIVAQTVSKNIGVWNPWPWVSNTHLFRQVFVVLNVGRNPKGQASAFRPLKGWTSGDG